MNLDTAPETQQKKRRGKGKNPAKAHVNLRLPHEVLEFYKQFPSYTGKMREVLTNFVRQHTAQD